MLSFLSVMTLTCTCDPSCLGVVFEIWLTAALKCVMCLYVTKCKSAQLLLSSSASITMIISFYSRTTKIFTLTVSQCISLKFHHSHQPCSELNDSVHTSRTASAAEHRHSHRWGWWTWSFKAKRHQSSWSWEKSEKKVKLGETDEERNRELQEVLHKAKVGLCIHSGLTWG